MSVADCRSLALNAASVHGMQIGVDRYINVVTLKSYNLQ